MNSGSRRKKISLFRPGKSERVQKFLGGSRGRGYFPEGGGVREGVKFCTRGLGGTLSRACIKGLRTSCKLAHLHKFANIFFVMCEVFFGRKEMGVENLYLQMFLSQYFALLNYFNFKILKTNSLIFPSKIQVKLRVNLCANFCANYLHTYFLLRIPKR